MVDAVLYFEQSESDLRFLRAGKNRYGAIEEIGIFRMGETGLLPVSDPSSVFLVHRNEPALPAGVVIAPVYEGSRVLLVEIQALTIPAKGSLMRTFSDRIDSRRVSRIAAVLEKHLGLRFSDQDIYVNVAGGVRIAEVGIDLPLACALYSARTGLSIDRKTTVTGELSLAGEIRPVPQLLRRIRASRDMGLQRCVGPAQTREDSDGGERWEAVVALREAIERVFDSAAGTKRTEDAHAG
jgi:DNA repair protein RadA/Sms